MKTTKPIRVSAFTDPRVLGRFGEFTELPLASLSDDAKNKSYLDWQNDQDLHSSDRYAIVPFSTLRNVAEIAFFPRLCADYHCALTACATTCTRRFRSDPATQPGWTLSREILPHELYRDRTFTSLIHGPSKPACLWLRVVSTPNGIYIAVITWQRG